MNRNAPPVPSTACASDNKEVDACDERSISRPMDSDNSPSVDIKHDTAAVDTDFTVSERKKSGKTGSSEKAEATVSGADQKQIEKVEDSQKDKSTLQETERENEIVPAGVDGSSIFPAKLHKILTDGRWRNIIHFCEDGQEWRVKDKIRLQQEVLPIFFRHTNYLSFTRSVVDWGFRRTGKATYYHELFRKDSPRLCLEMSRKSATKQKDHKDSTRKNNISTKNFISGCESIYHNPPNGRYFNQYLPYGRNTAPPAYNALHTRTAGLPMNVNHDNASFVPYGTGPTMYGGNTPPYASYQGPTTNINSTNAHYHNKEVPMNYENALNSNVYYAPSHNIQTIPLHTPSHNTPTIPSHTPSHNTPTIPPHQPLHAPMHTQMYSQPSTSIQQEHDAAYGGTPSNMLHQNNYDNMGSNKYWSNNSS